MRNSSLFVSLFLLFSACQKEENSPAPPETDEYVLHIPAGFPQPDIPGDNELTRSRVALGRRLFYDPVLSKDSTRSCGSCHFPHLAFSDSMAVSFRIENRPGTRNTPSLANVVYQKKLLREGGIPTLEMQILVPIQEHNEFDFNIVLVAERLQRMPEYVALAEKAYERAPDAFVITRAIAAFERTFLSGDSPYDQYAFQGKPFALSASAKRGLDLFQSERLNCSKCHEGFLFTNQDYSNNGLYEIYPDSGRMRLTGLESDRGVFKVPSLRNVALTAPYMHDGSLPTLEAVTDHYQTGGKAHPNKSPLLKPFALTAGERADLLAFLRSLTDQKFITNPEFSN
ncbi:MAG TPA: cytochrome c peroxidase [Saprospiraceae bacterium]|nr:cytochrome c peroxidase [Saprospiraceae bacterium]